MTADRTDWKGRAPDDFIGMETSQPAGVVVGGYVDTVDTILLDVRLPSGVVVDNVPLDAQPDGFPREPSP
jgi:hypothetical protein